MKLGTFLASCLFLLSIGVQISVQSADIKGVFPTNAIVTLTNTSNGKVYRNIILDRPSDTGVIFHGKNGAIGQIKYTDLSINALESLGLQNALDAAKSNVKIEEHYKALNEARYRYDALEQSQANDARQADAAQQAQTKAQEKEAAFQRAVRQAQIAVQRAINDAQIAVQKAQNDANFDYTDPYRKIDGQLQYAKGSNWVQFSGIVLQVLPNGIIVKGRNKIPGQDDDDRTFFVKKFPLKYGETETLPKNLIAKNSGLFTYQPTAADAMTVSKGTHAIRQLDYGTPCEPSEELITQKKELIKQAVETAKAAEAKKIENVKAIENEKVEAAKVAEANAESWLRQKMEDAKVAEAQKAEAAKAVETAAAELQKQQQREADERAFKSEERVFKWLQTQATNGSASAQCSLGQHYLTGQGCETDKEQAVYWLTQAANNGDIEASNILQKLNQKTKTTEVASPFDN